MVELTIKKLHVEASSNCKMYVSWKRGSKGAYEQSPIVTLGPERPEIDLNHTISRPTMFYTSDGGKTYDRKQCDFYVYGRNDQTNNRVILIGSAVNLNIAPFIGK